MWREAQGWRGSPHASGAFWSMTAVLLLQLGLATGIISCSFSPSGISILSLLTLQRTQKWQWCLIAPRRKADQTKSAAVAHFHLWKHLGLYKLLIEWSRLLGLMQITALLMLDCGKQLVFIIWYGKSSPHSEPVSSSCSGFPETMTVQLTGDL